MAIKNGRVCAVPNHRPAAAINFASPPPKRPNWKEAKPNAKSIAPARMCVPNSANGMPVNNAIGKNSTAVRAVNQFGMRNETTSPIAAMISNIGSRDIESVCNMGFSIFKTPPIMYGRLSSASHGGRKDGVNLEKVFR